VIAEQCDFLSIGTNDLIQYTLAVDRVNENVASLYDPLNLSILRLIKSVVDAAHKAGKWVGMCGEMAADPMYAMILLGMGLNELSVSPAAVPKIKKTIRNISQVDAKALARDVLESPNRNAIINNIKRHSTP
jgi:phosphotransferase system enzyme I (PtsI)